jgi:hypothetical protein
MFNRIKQKKEKLRQAIMKIISARCGQAERALNCIDLALSRKKSTL